MIKTFYLGAQKFTVKVVSDNGSNLGRAYTPLGLIEVQKNWEGRKIPVDSQKQTLCHEVVHVMLDTIGRNELSEDEVFVQSLGCLLHQFIETKKE